MKRKDRKGRAESRSGEELPGFWKGKGIDGGKGSTGFETVNFEVKRCFRELYFTEVEEPQLGSGEEVLIATIGWVHVQLVSWSAPAA